MESVSASTGRFSRFGQGQNYHQIIAIIIAAQKLPFSTPNRILSLKWICASSEVIRMTPPEKDSISASEPRATIDNRKL